MAAASEQLRALALPGKTVLAALLFALYLVSLAIYRLYFHPLAKFPGPKWAALTSWYEAYYEIALAGQYSSKISLLHDKYGRLRLVASAPLSYIASLGPTAWFDRSRG
jgi:hypothetical protein